MKKVMFSLMTLLFIFSSPAFAKSTQHKKKSSAHRGKSKKSHKKTRGKKSGGHEPASALPEKHSPGADRVRREYFQGRT